MRCGCISLGDIRCDDCDRTIRYLERYLAVEGAEDAFRRLCFECVTKRGWTRYRQERGERIDTFFSETSAGRED